MPIRVIKDASITVNGVDLSDHVSKVTLATSFDRVEVTPFGQTYKQVLQGLGDASITLEMYQDFDASEVDATLWPLSQSGSIFPTVVKQSNTTTSATNPTFTMQGVLLTYNPLDVADGQVPTTTVTISHAGTAGVVRATV